MSQRSLLTGLAVWSLLCCQTAYADLKVLARSPVGPTESTDAYRVISVTFDKPVVPLERLTDVKGEQYLRIEPPVKGKYSWQGTSTLIFEPEQPLSVASVYTAIVPKGVTSLISKDTLNSEVRWTFETVRPVLRNSDPYSGASWQELDQKVYLYFNQPMDPRKIYPTDPGQHRFISMTETGPDGKRTDVDFTIRNTIDKDSGGWGSEKARTIILLPVKPLKKDCTYNITIEKGVLGRDGTLGSLRDASVSFSTYKTFRFIRPDEWDAYNPSEQLKFIFTNPVRISDVVKAMTIEPKIEIPDYYDEDHGEFSCPNDGDACAFYLNTQLKAGTSYHVLIQPTLEDKYGQQLGTPVDTYIRTVDYPTRMYMPTGFGIVERYLTKLRHPLTILNLESLRLQKAIISPDNIIPFTVGKYSGPAYTLEVKPSSGGFTVDRIWVPRTSRNERTLLPIELKEVLGDARSGAVLLQTIAPYDLPYDSRIQRVLLQVTGMGITGKFSPDGGLAYVSYLKTGNPVEEADVEVRDDNNRILWTGKTNKNGFVRTPGWEELSIIPAQRWEKPRLWLFARKNGDFAYIHSGWGGGIYPYNFNISYDYHPRYPDYQGHIFTDRGIFRPGEQVYLKGIIREKRQGQWTIPRIKEYTLFIKDSRFTEVARSTITLSDYGSFNYTYPVDPNAPTGYYRVSLWEKSAGVPKNDNGDERYDGYYEWGFSDRKIRLSSNFRVEEFKPATFEVTAAHDRPEYIAGDTVTVKINGRYLFGASMPDAPLEYSARLENCSFTPDDYDGYVFESYSWDEEGYGYGDQTLVTGAGKLDAQGNGTFSYTLPCRNSRDSFRLISEATVTAPDRQKLSGRASAVVHKAAFYIGLRSESCFIEKGNSFKTMIAVVDPKGAPVKGRELACSLIRREWNSVRRGGTGGRWEWHSEVRDVTLSSCTLVSGTRPLDWSYKPDKSGYYFFKVKSRDDRGNLIYTSQYFYVTGRDYCAWNREDTDRIELVCDKTRYKPGETAKIMVKSPYESARAVVTLEREGIIDQWITTVRGSADTISVPLTNLHLPNVFVCVMLYQGRNGENNFSQDEKDEDKQDLGKPSFKIGYTNLPVDPGNKHLAVEVTPDKKEYRPGEKVTVRLKVLDARNRGTESEVNVAVSDYGILSLINYETPNSFPYFYGPRPLSVDTAESRLSIIGQRNYGEKGENRGGGGGLLADFDLRSKFIPTPFWDPAVRTDSSGNAVVSFVLPDNLTSFKVMATAHTKAASFGSGESRFAVNKPLILKPSLPRFSCVGDAFTAGVLCHNNTQKDGIVTVQAAAAEGITLIGENSKQVEVKKGEAQEVTFDFRADKVGKAKFSFKGVMGQETDGFKWEIPVSVPTPTEAVATCSSTLDKAKEGIRIPSAIFDESSSINLSVSPTALVGLKGGLEYLFQYPYGCLEQRTSKALPVILAGDFMDTFDLAPLKEVTAQEIITSYLKEVASFQDDSGGFCFWKDRIHPSPYLTSYVVWALAVASQKGYPVDQNVLRKAGDYLARYLRNDGGIFKWPYGVNADLTTRAFAVYALSMCDRHEQGFVNDLYAHRDQMPLMGKTYLLKAAAHEKMGREMIDNLTQDLYNKAKFSPTEVCFEEPSREGMDWIWDSNIRTTAAALQALLEVNGECAQADKVIKWLVVSRKTDHWMTTQENLYALYAFAEYVSKYEKDNPDFTAKVALEGKEIASELFKGRTLQAKNYKIPVTGFTRDAILPVTFTKEGQGRMYYDLRMIYAPPGEACAPLGRHHRRKESGTLQGHEERQCLRPGWEIQGHADREVRPGSAFCRRRRSPARRVRDRKPQFCDRIDRRSAAGGFIGRFLVGRLRPYGAIRQQMPPVLELPVPRNPYLYVPDAGHDQGHLPCAGDESRGDVHPRGLREDIAGGDRDPMIRKVVFIALPAAAGILSFAAFSGIAPRPMTSLKLLDRNGILLQERSSSEYGTAYRVTLNELPRHFIDALLVTEDKRFYSHWGVDPAATARSLFRNVRRRRVVSGGSTITQQLARNLHNRPRNVPAKVLEAGQAVLFELRYPKERILEEYVNCAPFGNGAYGIEAASRRYFAKHAKDLTPAESALLCAIPASNRFYDPYRNLHSALKRQKRILSVLYERGMLTKEQYSLALTERIVLYPKQRSFLAPHFCRMVFDRCGTGRQGELRTTLDYALQARTEHIVQNHLAKLKDGNVNNASVLVIDNRSQEVLALVGSSDFFDEQHQGQVNGVTSLRQPGSSVKPFVYGMAFEHGKNAASTLPDIPSNIEIPNGGFFAPDNYDKKFHGMVRARTALACSYNVATVNLAARFGPEMVLQKLRDAGMDSLDRDSRFYGPGLCLGSGEVTLWELARAYCGLANGGELRELRVLAEQPRQSIRRFLDPRAAGIVTDILSDNNARQPAFGTFSPLNLPFPCAAKTGTSKNFRDNWAVGYTPRYTVAVWVGNFDGKPMYSVSGISGAGPILRDIMLALELNNPYRDFTLPRGVGHRTVCAKSGKLPGKYCHETINEVFITGMVPNTRCDMHRALRLDSRNGLLCSADCPAEFVQEKIFEIYPTEYYGWARDSGIPLPPASVSVLSGKGGDGCYIEIPKDGEIYKIDPVLRREYQSISLKPKITENVNRLTWHIDNREITSSAFPYTVDWQLEPGKHIIAFTAEGAGRLLKSNKIQITVMP